MALYCDEEDYCTEEPDELPIAWEYNEDGTMTDPVSGNIYDMETGDLLGNTADQGQGGGSVVYDPDEFGDVYTVNGRWVGNIYGDAAPGQGSGRGPGAGTPGGAYSGGGGTGGGSQGGQNQNQSLAQLIQQLQQMLNQAKNSGGSNSVEQQRAIAAALRNAQNRSAATDTTKTILIAAGAVLALLALTPR